MENEEKRMISSYEVTQSIHIGKKEVVFGVDLKEEYPFLVCYCTYDNPLSTEWVTDLEAVTQKLVVGEEKDAYIQIATEKAYKLKDFVEKLFEWVKLDAGEQVYHFEKYDVNELTRNIVADWIPILESNCFKYDIDIPETEFTINIDIHAYARIINNLFQNILTHSKGDKLSLQIENSGSYVQITIADNGTGISASNLPHIFERMYQCDDSRLTNGNGLGLSIVKELINAHKGSIDVESVLGMGTKFTITFQKAL